MGEGKQAGDYDSGQLSHRQSLCWQCRPVGMVTEQLLQQRPVSKIVVKRLTSVTKFF